jgi:hypothetical protein
MTKNTPTRPNHAAAAIIPHSERVGMSDYTRTFVNVHDIFPVSAPGVMQSNVNPPSTSVTVTPDWGSQVALFNSHPGLLPSVTVSGSPVPNPHTFVSPSRMKMLKGSPLIKPSNSNDTFSPPSAIFVI